MSLFNRSNGGASVSTPTPDAVTDSVFQLLMPELQKALVEEKYTVPTPVQAQCIPHLLAGRDLLGSAQTGTGKTAAFTLPLLQYIAKNPRPGVRRNPRVLILAPTRELAAQIGDSIKTYGRHLRASHTVIFGGVGQRPQENAMSNGVDFLVATPGRLLDLMQQGFVNLRAVEAFVLDEADRMLDMGFINDIRKVIKELPAQRQTLFFSATLSPDIVTLASSLLQNPIRVTITPESPTVERIKQKLMYVDGSNKNDLLVSLMQEHRMDRVIVFTQMKHSANRVVEQLEKSGITAAAIHGNKSQGARTKALEGFKAGKVRALVATDIAARGLDVDGVTHVINYHIPVEPETYVHRIGRTARAGSDGDAFSFCSAQERDQVRAIERLIRKPIPVDEEHPYHSPAAAAATGAEARPEPKGQGGRGFRGPREPRSGSPRNNSRPPSGRGGRGGGGGGGGGRSFRPNSARGR